MPAAFDGTQPSDEAQAPSLEWEHIQRILGDCGATSHKPPEFRGLIDGRSRERL
jgi:hypothetical protein